MARDDEFVAPEYNIYANFTDTGKFLNMFKMRNAAEAGIVCVALGVPEILLLPISIETKIIVFILTVFPCALIALIGKGDDSWGQRVWCIMKWSFNRRKYHYRRFGYIYDEKQYSRYTKKKVKGAGKNQPN